MSRAAKRSPGSLRLRGIIVAHLRAGRARLGLAGVLLIVTVLAELAAPWPLKILFDHLLLAQPLTNATAPLAPLFALGPVIVTSVLAGTIFVLVLVGGACAYAQYYITARLGHELTYRLRRELFASLQRMPLGGRMRAGAGETVVKFAADTAALKDLVADWALQIVSQSLLIIAMLAIMFALNWRLALVVAATIPALALVLALLNRRIKRSLAAQRREEGNMATRVNEVLSAIALVRAFGRTDHEAAQFEAASARNLTEGIRTSRANAAVARAIAIVAAAATAGTLAVGTMQVLEVRMTPGDLLVFLAYLRALFKPLRGMGKLSGKIARAMVSATRISEVFDAAPPTAVSGRYVPDGALAGDIEFDNVVFGYGTDKPALNGVSFKIRGGERVAIVGRSGSGKSTIVSLLLRLHEPTSGTIRIDGRDAREYDCDALRAQIGVVLQDTLLFGATVRENIAYGRPDATQPEIEAAARAAQADSFIRRLPEGYDTVLGERGASLSGGEQQRLCLARALVKQPTILVLDEPTSAIDPISSRLVHEMLARVQRGRTAIVVTHELSSVRGFDRILVLESGRIVEAGSHGALMDTGRAYRALVEWPRRASV